MTSVVGGGLEIAQCVGLAESQSRSWLDPALLAAAKKEGSVVVYTSTNEREGLPLFKIFEDATGIKVHYVRAGDGKAYCPSGSPIFFYPLEAGPEAGGFFLGSGDDTFPVPAGVVRLEAIKGIEYELETRTVDVAPGETLAIDGS